MATDTTTDYTYGVFIGVAQYSYHNTSKVFMMYSQHPAFRYTQNIVYFDIESDDMKHILHEHQPEIDDDIYIRFSFRCTGSGHGVFTDILNLYHNYVGPYSLIREMIEDTDEDPDIDGALEEIIDYYRAKKFELYAGTPNRYIDQIVSKFSQGTKQYLSNIHQRLVEQNPIRCPLAAFAEIDPNRVGRRYMAAVDIPMEPTTAVLLDAAIPDPCPICYQEGILLRDSIKTSCGHQYCRGCFMGWVETKRRTRDAVCCPTCRCTEGLTWHGFCAEDIEVVDL